ncbi:MAG: (2Fe-2S)-binding protein, partial [Methyloversatilis sp.]|nr:(2Fe-2S)-binding protein [Methyloversatilis sp.]
RLTGETAAAGWLRDVMTGRQPTTDLRRWLFAPLVTPPVATATRGRIVCNCLDVAEPDIVRAIDEGADLVSLQQSLRCGTSCGSCVPELKRMLDARRQAA